MLTRSGRQVNSRLGDRPADSRFADCESGAGSDSTSVSRTGHRWDHRHARRDSRRSRVRGSDGGKSRHGFRASSLAARIHYEDVHGHARGPSGRTLEGGNWRPVPPLGLEQYGYHLANPAGGISMTLAGFARWMQAHLNGETTPSILSRKMFQTIRTDESQGGVPAFAMNTRSPAVLGGSVARFQLWWRGAKEGDRLLLQFEVPHRDSLRLRFGQ